MFVWRIASERHDPLDGIGAKFAGGRWNSRGHAVVYTSGTPTLAALERLAWADPEDLPDDLRLFRIDVPDNTAIDRLLPEHLPPDWHRPFHSRCAQIGDEWLASNRTAVLAVPSAIMPEEFNFLVNPLHPDARVIGVDGSRPFVFDERLMK
jgi:RES domain-containing protein